MIEHPEILAALGINAGELFQVLQDRKGVMWYCTAKGIFRQSDDSVRHFLPDPTGHKNGALRGYEDPSGNVWFLTAAGLFRASSDSFENMAPKSTGAASPPTATAPSGLAQMGWPDSIQAPDRQGFY